MADLKPFDGALDAPTSLQPFDGQLDGEAPKPSGMIRRIGKGISNTFEAGRIAATNDADTISGIISESERTREPATPVQQQMAADIAPYAKRANEAKGVVDNVLGYGALAGKRISQFASNPGEFTGMVAENIPNSLPGLAAGLAGAAGGAALAGPVGGVVGGIAGGTAGGYAVEQGSSMKEQILKEASARGINPTDQEALAAMVKEKYPAFLEASRLKGVGTAATDAALNVATLGLAGMGERVIAKEARALADMASAGKIGAEQAAKSLAALEAKQAARNTLGAKTMRGASVVGAEMVGEGLSEGVGQKLAYGSVDAGDVVDESLLGLGTGLGMAAGRKTISRLAGVEEKDAVESVLQNARDAVAANTPEVSQVTPEAQPPVSQVTPPSTPTAWIDELWNASEKQREDSDYYGSKLPELVSTIDGYMQSDAGWKKDRQGYEADDRTKAVDAAWATLSAPEGQATAQRRHEAAGQISDLLDDELSDFQSGLNGDVPPPNDGTPPVVPPAPPKPSEAMGLTPTAAPSLTNAAIIAVDTGASQPTMSAFDQREADRPKSIEGDVAITESGAPITNRLMAQKAAERKSSETGQSWQPIQLGAKQFVIRPMASDTAQQSVEATPLQTQTVQPDQNTEQPQTDAVQGQGTEAKGLDQGSLADATPKQQAPKVTGKPQPTTLGTQTNAVAGPGFGVNTARGMSNVKDAAQGTDTQATQAPGEAPKAVAGDAAASSELPATGSGTVEGRWLNQTLAQAEQAPVATNDVANQPWSMTKDTFDSWPRAMQWGFARQQGIKPESRKRDAEQEKNSHILATTPGGRGGDKAPDTFFSDIRNLHQEIVEKAIAEGKPVPAEVLADYPDLQNSSANKVGRKDSAQLAQPESVVLPTQNATNNTPTAPIGAPTRVASTPALSKAPDWWLSKSDGERQLVQKLIGVKVNDGNWASMSADEQRMVSQQYEEFASGNAKVDVAKLAASMGITGKPAKANNTPTAPTGAPTGVTPKSPSKTDQAKADLDHLFGVDQKRAKAIERIANGAAYFSKPLKAQEFIAKNGLKDTHKSVKTSPNRWDIVSKSSQPTEKPSAQATKTQQVQAERPPQGSTAATTDKPAADAGVAAAGQAEVAKSKKPSLKDRMAQERQARADYFTPGNIVTSYSGHDEVISYTPPKEDGGGWSVKVHAVKKVNGEWVRIGKPQDARTHSTQPDAQALKSGPLDKVKPAAAADVPHAEQRADGKPFPNSEARGEAEQVPTAAPEVAPERTAIKHAGVKIYPITFKDEPRWAVQTDANKTSGKVFGDTIHTTLEEAKASAEHQVAQAKDQAERTAADEAEKAAAQAKKDANKGKSIVERRKDSILDGVTKLPVQAGLGNGTKRESMQKAVDQERAIVEKMVDDTAAKKRDNEAIDLVRAKGFILGLSNENLPVVKAGLEAQARLKANDYKKPSYRVHSGRDTKGSFYEITKTEYDYAQELLAQPPVSKTETTELDKKSTHFWKGETFRDIGSMVIASPDVYVRKEPKFTGSNLLEAPKEFDYFLTDGRRNQKISKDVADYIASLKTAKAEQPVQPAGKYQGPSDVSTRAGQMELANRAGRIASLKAMNGQLRQIAPNEAWADANIESANDLDALQDQISTALVAAGKGAAATAKAPDALRTELKEMSGAELRAIFEAMNLAGKNLMHSERVDMLMAEDAAEVRAAIAKAQPAAQEPIKEGDTIKHTDGNTYTVVDVYGNTVDAERTVESAGGVTRKAGISLNAAEAMAAKKAAPEPAKPAGNTMFSRKAQAPADIKNLVTLHNLNADNLLYSNSIGGIPVPSIGITKVDSAFGGFGDITLIAPKGMIDPSNGTPVYDRDAYTARHPTLNYKKVKAAKADAFYDRIVKVRELGFDGGFVTQAWDAIKNASTQNPDKVWSIFQGNDAPRLLYASEVLGKSVKIPTRNVPVDFPWVADKQFAKTLEKLQQALNDYPSMEVEASPEMAELSKAARAAIERLADKKGPWDDPVLRDDFMEAMAVSWGNSGAWVLKPDAVMPWKTLDRVLNSARNVGKTEVDKTELSKRLDKLVKSSDKAYADWALGMIKPLFEPPTITLRGKEVEPTLQNVVEAMTTGATAGAEKTMTSGPGKIAALLGKRFKSLAQIQEARDQVVPEAAEKAGKEATDAILDAYRTRALSFYTEKDWRGQVDTWGAMDASMEALAAAGKMGTGDGAIRMALARKGFKAVDQTTVDLARQSIDAIRSTTTNYFEAKPQRAVKLNEFRAAVVPKGTSKEVLDVLAANGIQVATYNKADPEAKNKALEKLARKVDKEHGDVLFSRGAKATGLPVNQVQSITDLIAERWANAPEIVVAADMNDAAIPQAVRDEDAKQRSQGATGAPEGFYYGGKVYVVADQLNSPGDVIRVLFHETLGHAGLRGVFGKELNNILRQIATMRRKEIIAKAREYGLVRADKNGDPVVDVEKATDAEVLAEMDESHKLQAAEEVLAQMAQDKPELGFVKRAIAAIRTFLRNNVPGFEGMKMTDAEIINSFIMPARNWVKSGKSGVVGGIAFSRGTSAKDQTDTAAFKAWFAGSKVVGEDGKPLVMYHGTPDATFTIFKPESYFTSQEDIAKIYTGTSASSIASSAKKGEKPDVYAVYLSIKKPFDTRIPSVRKLFKDKFYMQYGTGTDLQKSGLPDWNDARDLADWINEEGLDFDGIVVDEGGIPQNDGSVRSRGVSYIPLQGGAQIKSATDNNGNFDPANPDIRYSRTKSMGATLADDSTPGDVTDFSKPSKKWGELFFGDATTEKVSELQKWLKQNPNAKIRMYHGTSILNDIKNQGVLRTSSSRKNSLQSGAGYSYWSIYPGQAKTFGEFGSANRGSNSKGEKVAVYFTDFSVSELLADVDQLKNRRQFAGDSVGNTLAESLVYGKGARVKADVSANRVNRYVAKNESTAPDSGGAMFSRTMGNPLTGAANSINEVKLPAGYLVGDFFNSAPGKLGLWFKTVGTQYHLAQKSPAFKRVFDAVQTFLNDVSYYATEAADLAPSILPKLETWKDIWKSPVSAADTKAFSAPVFEGTLNWGRDESGKAVRMKILEVKAKALTTDQKAQRLLRNNHLSEGVLKMWRGLPVDQFDAMVESKFERDMLKAGVVFTDAELQQHFNLTPNQIKLYREFRKATDKSLTNLAIADMLRFGGDDVYPIREAVLESKTADQAANALSKYLLTLTEMDPGRANVLTDTANKMIEKGDKATDLINRGYAPLSRFGQYTLDVVDAAGERVYFGMFESKWEAARMARQMRESYPAASIKPGTVSQEEYKMFSGVSPETLALFGDMLGLDGQGDAASAQAFQTYLKLAQSNRSAMKRLIQRKGIAGFNEDAGRVLAGFVYSNARQTSTSLHMGEMTNATNDMPKHQGELKDAAVKLVDYIKNPQEEAQAIRGLMFTQFIGGSIASAMVNLTQPITMTLPWLTQYGGAGSAAKTMASAIKDAYKKTTGDAKLDAAIKLAEEKGIVSPQEVHQLMKQAQGQAALRSGDGTKLGNAAATAQNTLSRFMMAWGKPFSWAEQMNRRVTFIAAYRTAIAQKMGDPMAFAERAIEETQGIYNKANKPTWARGALGGTLFTFKQYSIAYVEMLQRMYTSGPEGKKAALLALGILFLLSGASGFPGADDLDDLISGALQSMGYNFDSKQKRKEFFVSIMGEDGARFMERGISGLPGVPIDVAGRMGLGNLIPGTGLLQKKPDHTRDVAELFGPVGGFAKQAYDATGKALSGEILGARGAIAAIAPKAAQNLFQASEMASTDMYKDSKGNKVISTDSQDALVKALGFQPNDVARAQDANSDVQRMKGLNIMRESEIADQWAKGLFEKDDAKVKEARAELAQWNADNPESPIRINFKQIMNRVHNMNLTKAERIIKTTPKEIRAAVKRELAAQ